MVNNNNGQPPQSRQRFAVMLLVVVLIGCSCLFFFLVGTSSSSSSPSSSSRKAEVRNGEFGHDVENVETMMTRYYTKLEQQEQKLARFISESVNNTNRTECNTNGMVQQGFYWKYSERRCVPIPGWSPPLMPFEVSSHELSCYRTSSSHHRHRHHHRVTTSQEQQASKKMNERNPSTTTKHKNAADDDDDEWRFFYFQNASAHLSAPDSTCTPASYWPECHNETYKNFAFHTSWLFRQYLPWTPHPELTTKKPLDQLRFKSFHDAASENVFRLERFCLTPFDGIWGYNPDFAEYYGKDDTRNKFHAEKTFGSFFGRMGKLEEPPPAYDRRPVLITRVAPLSRFHIYHVMNKFMSMLGILKIMNPKYVARDDDDDDASAENDNKNTLLLLKPLIVFVNEALDDAYDSNPTVNTAWGFLLRLLDMPWAVVEVPGHIRAIVGLQRDRMRYADHVSPDYHRKLFDLTGHAYTRHASDKARVCFERGVAYQNCFKCNAAFDNVDPATSEMESYSFGTWVQPTLVRVRLVKDFRRLVKRCLPPQRVMMMMMMTNYKNNNNRVVSSSSSKRKTSSRRPRVFFAVRSRTRVIQDLPLMVDFINSELSDVVESPVMFREPNHGSRAAYLRDVRSADLFVGLHGGDFAQVALMKTNTHEKKGHIRQRRKSVVVEFSFKPAVCETPVLRPTCWFGIYSGALGIEHWVAVLERYPHFADSVSIPPSVIVDIVKAAACRWYDQKTDHHGGNNNNNNNGKDKYSSDDDDDDQDDDSSASPPPAYCTSILAGSKQRSDDDDADDGSKIKAVEYQTVSKKAYQTKDHLRWLYSAFFASSSSSSSSSFSFLSSSEAQRVAKKLAALDEQERTRIVANSSVAEWQQVLQRFFAADEKSGSVVVSSRGEVKVVESVANDNNNGWGRTLDEMMQLVVCLNKKLPEAGEEQDEVSCVWVLHSWVKNP